MTTNSKINAYIGFAIKKRAVVFGLDMLLLHRKKIYLIICSDDLADNSYKKAIRYAEERSCPIVKMQGLQTTLNSNCKVLAICDKSLADAIQNNLL